MTIAIFALVFIEAIALTYFGLAVLEIRDKMNSTYPELVKLMAEQNKLLRNNLDILNKWADTTADLIAHVERIEDLEGDIKDIFEWIHSVDNNVADMRRDIQDTDTKLGDLMAVYDRNIIMFDDDVRDIKKDIQLIQDSVSSTLFIGSAKKIKKDIREIKEHLGFEEEYDWNQIIVDADNHGDTGGDISEVRYPHIQAEKLGEIVKGEDNDNNRDE